MNKMIDNDRFIITCFGCSNVYCKMCLLTLLLNADKVFHSCDGSEENRVNQVAFCASTMFHSVHINSARLSFLGHEYLLV